MAAFRKTAADLENAVRRRYSLGAKGLQHDLCCPTSYDPKYLKAIPHEVIERDYGCGDPSRHLREGELSWIWGLALGRFASLPARS